MADFFVNNNVLQPTTSLAAPIVAPNIFEPRAVFSISPSNTLQGSFWVVKNGEQINSGLGFLSFTFKDAAGNSIGIAQSNLASDIYGVYRMTAVSAAPLQDLTHYLIEIEVIVESENIKGVVALTLAE